MPARVYKFFLRIRIEGLVKVLRVFRQYLGKKALQDNDVGVRFGSKDITGGVQDFGVGLKY